MAGRPFVAKDIESFTGRSNPALATYFWTPAAISAIRRRRARARPDGNVPIGASVLAAISL